MEPVALITVIALFAVLVFFVPVEFRVEYHKKDRDDLLTVQLWCLWGLARCQAQVPVLTHRVRDWGLALLAGAAPQRPRKERSGQRRWWAGAFRFFGGTLRWLRWYRLVCRFEIISRRFFKGIRCRKLYWVTRVGFADPAVTGMVVGLLWAGISAVVTRFYRNVTVLAPNPQIRVEPSFGQPVLRLDFDCIISLRIGHIIITGVALLWAAFRRR